jgi:dTDP-4-dehydrorhamnose reductase
VRVLVTGAGGLLGSLLVERAGRAGHDVVAATRADVDVTDGAAVRRAISDAGPDWVVHCAAWTAVDRAEAEPEAAFAVNARGAGHVASAAAASGARLAHVSTDYVFDGRRRAPYRVGDRPNPLSVYGRSKWAGERAVRRAFEEGSAWGAEPLIVRTGWLYGEGGRGFVRTIVDRASAGAALRVVDDQVGRPTSAANVTEALLDLIERGAGGIWHVADRGEATWLEFAREAVRIAGMDVDIEGVSTASWGAPAPRPGYSVLDLGRTEEALGRPMQEWKEALAVCLGPAREPTMERV